MRARGFHGVMRRSFFGRRLGWRDTSLCGFAVSLYVTWFLFFRFWMRERGGRVKSMETNHDRGFLLEREREFIHSSFFASPPFGNPLFTFVFDAQELRWMMLNISQPNVFGSLLRARGVSFACLYASFFSEGT